MQTKTLALKVARAALDKGARSIQIIDLRGRADYADLLVLCSGTSTRHVAAIAEAIEQDLRKSRVRPASVEGLSNSQWVLIDFIDVVAHVFLEEVRTYYDLEGLWMDAPRLAVPEPPARPAASRSTRPPR
ncbi:MAG: ribosome silencing factor [Myxococcales bacterium]|nr:ribosome silencing factor [Myxococcales bacterium]